MPRADLDYLTITDFTPGIYSKWGASTQLGRDGAAQVNDGDRFTFGCYGDPDGGLRPLPRRVKTFVNDTVERCYSSGLPNVRDISPSGDKVAVVDFLVVGSHTQARYSSSSGATSPSRESWPEATSLHPDSLYAITSHFTKNYTSIYQFTSWPSHSTGAAYDPVGARVGMFKVWEVSRMADGGTALNTVEVELQTKIQAISWTKTQPSGARWGDYTASKGITYLNPSLLLALPYSSAEQDTFHTGVLCAGRSIFPVTAATGDDSSTITLETLDYPGNVTVVASLWSNVSTFEPSPRIDGFPNMLALAGPVKGSVSRPGGVRTSTQAVFPFGSYSFHLNGWSFSTGAPSFLVYHQDRFIGAVRALQRGTPSFFDPGTDPDGDTSGGPWTSNMYTMLDSERLYYTEFKAALCFDVTTGPSSTTFQFWCRESETRPRWQRTGPISGVGVMATWDNDILLVGHHGGGVLIRGSIEQPTFIPLEGVHSTGGVSCIPAHTPLGVVYGTRDGVVAWNGEPSSKIISSQLDGWFWGTGAANEVSLDDSLRRVGAISGRFAYSWPFVYAPNSWVMDVRTGGWFRLTDQSPDVDTNPYKPMFYATNQQGKVYACRGCYDASNLNLIDLFDPNVRATRYRWVSQPLYRTVNRDIFVNEVVLVAQGSGNVTVILLGIDGDEQDHTFPINASTRPTRLTAPFHLRASDIVVVIEAEGDDPDIDAPTVHAVHLGVSPDRVLSS